MVKALGGEGSDSSLSVAEYSDSGDPIFDESIINELFYKHSVSFQLYLVRSILISKQSVISMLS